MRYYLTWLMFLKSGVYQMINRQKDIHPVFSKEHSFVEFAIEFDSVGVT